jgi:hypothetical protein
MHSDSGGPITPASLTGERYYTTATDEASRKAFLEVMKAKSEALIKLKEIMLSQRKAYWNPNNPLKNR